LGVLLLAALTGCGGGGDEGAAAAAKPADAAAAIEEEGAPARKAQAEKPAVSAPQRPTFDASQIPDPSAPLAREKYTYSGGRRDPFESVLETASTGPELPDLVLVSVLYVDRAPATSVAVMHDKITGKRYTVREGDRLGRMRVSGIRPKDVTFTIDDFGTERQATLSIRKQEVK
jgi:hypothetical protein